MTRRQGAVRQMNPKMEEDRYEIIQEPTTWGLVSSVWGASCVCETIQRENANRPF